MTKRALVLGGGGSRGSYEFGAVVALKELGVEYDTVIGTSIGALNAVFIAQGDMDLYEKLWNSITIDRVMKDGINLYDDLSRYRNGEIGKFFKTYRKNGGADISPLIHLVRSNIDEEKVRRSPVRLGVVTVKFPSFEPVEIMVDKMPVGSLVDYVIASASLFPAFPTYKMFGNEYIDGGYYDTVAANFAFDQGAEEVVCFDLLPSQEHPHLKQRSCVKYICPARNLGSVLLFEQEVLSSNRRRGYNDTMKNYGKYAGGEYAFEPGSLLGSRRAAQQLSLSVCRAEAKMAPKNALGKIHMPAPLSERLNRQLALFPVSRPENELLAAGEICGNLLGADDTEVSRLRLFKHDRMAQLPTSAAMGAVQRMRGRTPVELRGILNPASPAMRIAVLAEVLRQDGPTSPRVVDAAQAFTEEFLAALFITSAV